MLEVDAREPASELQIAEVESALGFQLPEAYRSWLKATNGAEVPQDTPVPGTEGNGLFSEFEPVERLPMVRAYEGSDVIPRDYVAVNIGDGGAVAIKVRGDDIGSVWWADFDQAELLGIADGSSQEIMRRLADNWDEFLALDFED
ncbi:SMI1/KNR4 family protein [Microlunatus parietis]|uniref:Knr4/Smi1-like domain-containing protein n=1 Tax=Microlunatus parietis TaxID=682979 RepID=A0A7Y9I6R5_9ACTN|nr:SMI1/KNR4 family protein [Microlunatus parietis]NYE71080.1 hypothetical protein [Microlunatus parietis]